MVVPLSGLRVDSLAGMLIQAPRFSDKTQKTSVLSEFGKERIHHADYIMSGPSLGHRDIEFHRDIDTPLHQKHPTLERYTNNTECDTEEMTFRQTVACVEQRNS